VKLTLVGDTFKAGEIFTGWLRKDLAELVRDEGFSVPKLPPVRGLLWPAARAAGLKQLLSYREIAAELGAALAVHAQGPGNGKGRMALPVSLSPGSLAGRTAVCSRESRQAGRLHDR
jgi:sugar phosphate isomerase/epimerase